MGFRPASGGAERADAERLIDFGERARTSVDVSDPIRRGARRVEVSVEYAHVASELHLETLTLADLEVGRPEPPDEILCRHAHDLAARMLRGRRRRLGRRRGGGRSRRAGGNQKGGGDNEKAAHLPMHGLQPAPAQVATGRPRS